MKHSNSGVFFLVANSNFSDFCSWMVGFNSVQNRGQWSDFSIKKKIKNTSIRNQRLSRLVFTEDRLT